MQADFMYVRWYFSRSCVTFLTRCIHSPISKLYLNRRCEKYFRSKYCYFYCENKSSGDRDRSKTMHKEYKVVEEEEKGIEIAL